MSRRRTLLDTLFVLACGTAIAYGCSGCSVDHAPGPGDITLLPDAGIDGSPEYADVCQVLVRDADTPECCLLACAGDFAVYQAACTRPGFCTDYGCPVTDDRGHVEVTVCELGGGS